MDGDLMRESTRRKLEDINWGLNTINDGTQKKLCLHIDGKDVWITLEDVVKYFAYEAQSMSGYRTLGSVGGDWRPIDRIAQCCSEYFKCVNIKGYRALARKYGLEPKF